MSLILIGDLVVELSDDAVLLSLAALRKRGSLSCREVKVVIVGAHFGILSGVTGLLKEVEDPDEDDDGVLGVGILGPHIICLSTLTKGFAIGVPRFGREVDNLS